MEVTWTEDDFQLASRLLQSLLGHRGSLMKKGEKNANWRRRFFTLGMDTDTGRYPLVKLFYYESEENRRHINFILIGPHTEVKTSAVTPPKSAPDTGFCVSEAGGGGRTYHLAADCEDEQIQWVVVLRKIVRVLQQREQQGRGAEGGSEAAAAVERSPSPPEAAAVRNTSAKAEKLLARGSGARAAAGEQQRRASALRSSLDLIVERASGLEAAYAGKRLTVRVACVNAATSIFTWWEYTCSGPADVAEGVAEWHADFSFEGSGVGTELILRVTDARDAVVAEARVDPSEFRNGPAAGGQAAVALPLRPPLWERDDVSRGGGTLREDDVLRQGGKRDAAELRGHLQVRLAHSADAGSGMLCRLGLLADPIPLRLQSGDVLLFSQSTGAARITKIFTWSRWSHAALIVRRRNGFLSVLEATGDGVGLYDLDNVWWRYHKIGERLWFLPFSLLTCAQPTLACAA